MAANLLAGCPAEDGPTVVRAGFPFLTCGHTYSPLGWLVCAWEMTTVPRATVQDAEGRCHWSLCVDTQVIFWHVSQAE